MTHLRLLGCLTIVAISLAGLTTASADDAKYTYCHTVKKKTFGPGPSWEAKVFDGIDLRNLLPVEYDKAVIAGIAAHIFNADSYTFYVRYEKLLASPKLNGTVTFGKTEIQFDTEDIHDFTRGGRHEVDVPGKVIDALKTGLSEKQNGRLVVKSGDRVLFSQNFDAAGYPEALAFAIEENSKMQAACPTVHWQGGKDGFIPF